MTDALKQGDFAYAPDGRRVQYLGEADVGVFVRVGFTAHVEDDAWEDFFEEVRVVDRIYREPPVELFDATIADRKSEIAALEAAIEELHRVRKDTERHNHIFLKNAEKFKQLVNLEKFIGAGITHYVIVAYGSVTVTPKDNAKCEYSKRDLKLLTLFGNTKGELCWRLNSYSDGSGSNFDVIPCISQEEAEAAARSIVADMLAYFDDKTSYYLAETIASAVKLGVPIPHRAAETVRVRRMEKLAKELADLDGKRNVITAQLAAVEKGAAA